MKQSDIFLNTRKESPKDEVSINAKLLIRANFIEKLMAGVFSMLPLGLRVKNKTSEIIRDEMNKLGADEILMPALHPKSVWEPTGRWEEIDVMYKMKDNSGRELGLGTTHEEVITHLAKRKVESYNDLPFSLYQIQTKYRDEERPKSGLLRGREFTMKDLYSFHESDESLNKFYEKVKKVYFNIFERCGLGDITYLTFAPGGTFSKYSHEFQTVSDIGEDTIHICDDCKIAVNEEIIHDQNSCPECGNENLREESAIEVGNIFKLGTKFSDPVDLNFQTESGDQKSVIMASYGIGVERLMGAVVEVYNDKNGIIWPESLSPFDVHLLGIGEMEDKLQEEITRVYNNLKENNIDVLLDDRQVSAGEKFADSDLIGIPWRVVISNNTISEGKIEVKRRDSENAELIDMDKFIKNIK